MANEQVAKSVDLLWDGWFNSFKSVQQFQEDLEKKTLQAFNYQKELLDSTVTAFNSIEEETKKAAKEWQEKVQQSITDVNTNGQFDQITKWIDGVQEILDKAQVLSWKPSNTILDLLAQTQTQVENTVKAALEQQKQERSETLNKIEELTEQLKDTHKKLVAVK